jgi:hypothetical protein
MDTIVISTTVFGKNEYFRVVVETIQNEVCAWTKDFHNAKDLQRLLLELAPAESTKIADFITLIVNFGEGQIVIPCAEKDFSKFGFARLPPA